MSTADDEAAPRRVSKYLQYFDILDDWATCKIPGCKKRYKRKGSATPTSSLLRHLTSGHGIAPSLLGQDFESRVALKPIVEFFIHHGVPLNALSCACFKQMFTAIQSSGEAHQGGAEQPPGKDLAKSCLAHMHNEERTKVRVSWNESADLISVK